MSTNNHVESVHIRRNVRATHLPVKRQSNISSAEAKQRTQKRVAGFNSEGEAVLLHKGIDEGGAAEFTGVGEGFEDGVEDERGSIAERVGV